MVVSMGAAEPPKTVRQKRFEFVVDHRLRRGGVKKDEKIAKMLPSSVTKDGKLTVGMDTSYAPAEFLAADGKTPVGYDVDIVKAFAKTLGLEAEPKIVPFRHHHPINRFQVRIGISAFTITQERMKSVDFVSNYQAGSTWAVKKGNPKKIDTSDMCGCKIAVQTGTIQEDEVNKSANGARPTTRPTSPSHVQQASYSSHHQRVTGKADVFTPIRRSPVMRSPRPTTSLRRSVTT